jgi:manganese-dependent inorganic pyrophosphatase
VTRKDWIKGKNVVGIIDHRKHNEVEMFPNADVQIELVGAAATLVAEKFFKARQPISRSAACLLYAGIISNTLNLKAKVTTARDRKMMRWLCTQTKIPKNMVSGMFLAKSDLRGNKLQKQLKHDFAHFRIGKKIIGIAQLEIVRGRGLTKHRLNELKRILDDTAKQQHSDHTFLSIINLIEGNNTFVCFDPNYQLILEKILKIKFKQNIANRPGLIMRKEIVPKLVANEVSG